MTPDNDQKRARLRDLERLRELIHPHVTSGDEPIRDALHRMPPADRAEVETLLASTAAEAPEKAAAREEILLDLARAEAGMREILTRPHYKVRRGKVVTDPATGEPVRDTAFEKRARDLLDAITHDRDRYAGLPPRQDDGGSAH